jgi:UDP-N-acetylglucosamine 2-epimerase (non-hydrolysing)
MTEFNSKVKKPASSKDKSVAVVANKVGQNISKPPGQGQPTDRVLVVFGTRPEAIKMAPVVAALRCQPRLSTYVCVTGQHRQMLDQVLDIFDIKPDFDLNVMRASQSLESTTAEILLEVGKVLVELKPQWVLVHGDTSTAFAAALACFYRGVRVGHVEAGLRTGDLHSPWPEEMNRCFVDMVSDLLWAPTVRAEQNLLNVGKQATQIRVTGNTVIDALFHTRAVLTQDRVLREQMKEKFSFLNPNKRLILVTGHRRESFSGGLSEICAALVGLSSRPDVEIVWPVHLNPLVQSVVSDALAGRDNIHLLAPQDYLSFVELMCRSYLIITDSGGIQEEAPALDKPVLVARDVTERPEVLDVGAARLVGTTRDSIVEGAVRILDSEEEYRRMASAPNPFGDGRAAERIVDTLIEVIHHE